MSTYLLLRNNKETGPLSMDQLLEKGLKAYDLVWVEGRSAAWRYPCEIEELKPYAPVVDEQPFDRFFKKPSEQNHADNGVQDIPVTVVEKPVAEKKTEPARPVQDPVVMEEKHVPYQPVPVSEKDPRQVFVSLPSEKQQPAAKVVPVTLPATDQIPIKEKYEEKVAEKVVRLEKRFEQPIEEITDRYAQALIDRKKKSSRRRQFNGILARATPFLLVLGVGVVIGLYLNRDKGNGPAGPHDGDVATHGASENTPGFQAIPAVSTENELADQQATNSAAGDSVNTDPSSVPAGTTVKLKKVKRNLSGDKRPDYDDSTAPGSEVDPLSGERNKVVRDGDGGNDAQAAEETMTFKDLMKKVYISNNNYTRGAFGGIKNLELTVMNDTKYLLDEVTVELQYLKPSELPLKSETLRFTSVAPKGTMTIKIPDSQRGVKITYRVIKVNSRQLADALAKNS